MALEFNDKNFEQEVKEFKGVVLVDFWAPWCGPCKMQGPIIDELAIELQANNKVKIGKVNVDENKASSEAFEVMSIPTLKIFKDGQVVEDMVGMQTKEFLLKNINKHLS